MSAMQGALSAAERSMRSVFVGNIPYEATEEQLKDIFAEVGPVISFRLVYDRETGKPKGYGFCEYKDQETALSAMRNLNSYELNGRALRVDNAASEKSKEELKNLQASLGGPPVESPFGPEVDPEKAPTAISKVMCSVPPEQLNELMIQMKACLENNPHETRNMLLQNPQLAYALLQAQVLMKNITVDIAKTMLHDPNYQPPAPGALLPTPEERKDPVSAPTAPVIVNDAPAFQSAMPMAPMMPMQPNPVMPNPRPSQPVAPITRPSLLGERPPVIHPERPGMMPERPMLPPNPANNQNAFMDRAQYHQPPVQQQNRWNPNADVMPLGDHDLRQLPMADRDLRQPPVMGVDKDMRQPMPDQDHRAMGGPGGMPPDNRAFDPRFRNMPRPEMQPSTVRPMLGPDPRTMAGPNVRPMEGPSGYDRPRMMSRPPFGQNPNEMDPQQHPGPMNAPNMPPGIRGQHNPRMPPVGGSPNIHNSPNPNASPRPANPIAAAAAAIAPHDQEKAQLIMQVLQLSDQQIAMLPAEQRQSIMILKQQIARSQQM